MNPKSIDSKRKHKFLSRTTISLVVLFFFCVGAGWGIAGAVDLINVMYNLDGDGSGNNSASLDGSGTLPERINILIIGADTRTGENRARSDALMVASLDRKTGKIAVVSIPRDSRVQIPGHGYNKINAAYALGGAKLALQTVEPILGVEIPYYVATNFNGFKDIIDTLGGVTIDVEQKMYYPEEDINLQAGLQRLDGRDALGFVRYRYLPLGDIDRVKNQKKFLMALADEMFKLKTVTKIPQLIPQIQNCVETNFTPGEMLDVALAAAKTDPQAMIVTTLPGDFLEMPGGSYWQVNEKLVSGLLNKLMEPGAVVPEWRPTSIVMGPTTATEKNVPSLPEQTQETGNKTTENSTPINNNKTNNGSTKGSTNNTSTNNTSTNNTSTNNTSTNNTSNNTSNKTSSQTNTKTVPNSDKTGSDSLNTEGSKLPDSTNSNTNPETYTETNTNIKTNTNTNTTTNTKTRLRSTS